MCDSPPEKAQAYVHQCLVKYLRMLEQSDSVEISLAAYDWQQHISMRAEKILMDSDQEKKMKTQVIIVEFGGEVVGCVKNAVPDMWQMEGDWVRSSSQEATRFESFAAKVNDRSVAEDVRTGQIIRCYTVQGEPYLAYVIGLVDDRLMFRKFSSVADSRWAQQRYEQSSE